MPTLWVWTLFPVLAAAQTSTTAPDNNGPAQELPPVRNSVTVVGKVETETPSNVSVLNQTELSRIPGVSLDDRLRIVPGFSLFRRSSSLVANPTTQGVSLRAIAPSGAGRTLVLWDGVPVNDPFGGWVYWTRIPADRIERVEVLRTASTSVFGDRAMGGAIAIFSPTADQSHLSFSYDGGNAGQHLLGAGFAQPFGRFALSGGFQGFSTDGYYIVPSSIRGAADTKAGVDFVSPDLRFDYFGNRQRFYVKADILLEDRDNGTVLQRNSTSLGTISGHYEAGDVNQFSLLGYHTREEYRQSFSAILAGRNSERLTSWQSVPSEAEGGSFLYRRDFSQTSVVAGADLVRVEGFATVSLPTGTSSVAGGDQLQHGIFGQVRTNAGPAQLFAGLRHHFAGNGNQFWSPSGGIVIGRNLFRARASVYRSFRAPTLNELYREFRAGTALTQANSELTPESVTGVETGFDLVGETRRFGTTFFYNSLDDLVTNVTLSITPSLILRQRQNAAAAFSRGVEMDARQRWHAWTGEMNYLFVESRFSTGARLPQIPRHQGSAQVSYAHGGTVAALGFRAYAFQFEDDLNQFVLPGFAVLQFTARQRIGKGVSAQFALENALDRTFLVGYSPPVASLGAPRLWRLGLRWDGKLR